jgi:signal transduction histidine kinase
MAETLIRSLLPHLTIRQKVLAGTVIPVILFSVLGVASYNYLVRLEASLTHMEMADDLANTILEVRRYEKNFLLYAHEEDYDEAQRFMDLARSSLTAMSQLTPQPRPRKALDESLSASLDAYQGLTLRLRSQAEPPGSEALARVRDQLRQAGKDMVDTSLAIKNSERERILRLVSSLMRQLAITGVLLLTFGSAMALLLGRKILYALDTIAKATAEIGQGRFKTLDVPRTNDETQRVLEAFNRMTRELERRQDQLIQEKKLSSLGVLTSGIAHQLNNPLNNISTSCQILQEEQGECEPEFAARMLGNIQQEVLRARDIVKGLLEFSRAKDFSLKRVSLDDVAAKAFRLVSSQVPSGIALIKDIPQDLTLDLDAARIQEAFINLLLNAAQAIPDPTGSITVSARVDEAAKEAVIAVEDTGTGIPDEDLGKIFDPFYTTKEVGKGTGLGLSIVFGIIEKHKGSITAERTGGKGARFVIRLPLSQVPEAQEGAA